MWKAIFSLAFAWGALSGLVTTLLIGPYYTIPYFVAALVIFSLLFVWFLMRELKN